MQEKLDQFRKLCQNHDLTYTYSDDGSVYRRGEAEYAAIRKLAAELPKGEAARIWNEVVMTKMRYPVDYLWSE